MRTVFVAKSSGGGVALYPEGYTVETIPHDLHTALEQAFKILSWQENLPEDEMPPRWMWHLDWELDAHFEVVKRKREEKYGISSSDSDGDSPDLWEENDLAARFKK